MRGRKLPLHGILNGCNGIWTHNHLVRKQTLNHLPKYADNVNRSCPLVKNESGFGQIDSVETPKMLESKIRPN